MARYHVFLYSKDKTLPIMGLIDEILKRETYPTSTELFEQLKGELRRREIPFISFKNLEASYRDEIPELLSEYLAIRPDYAEKIGLTEQSEFGYFVLPSSEEEVDPPEGRHWLFKDLPAKRRR